MNNRTMLWAIVGLGALLLVSGCTPTPPPKAHHPYSPSPTDIEHAIEASMVSSFSFNVDAQDGTYRIVGSWEAAPDEDPNAQYWLLLGTAEAGFVPVVTFTGAEATEPVQVASMNPVSDYSREYLVAVDDAMGALQQLHPQPRPAAGGLTNFPFPPEVMFTLIHDPGTGAAEHEAMADHIAKLLQSMMQQNAENAQQQPLLLAELLRYYEASLAPSSHAVFDVDHQLLPSDTGERLRMITEFGLDPRLMQVMPPTYSSNVMALQLQHLNRTRLLAQGQEQQQARLREILTLRVQQDPNAVAEVTTPQGEHSIALCSFEGGPFEFDGYDITHCQPEPELMIFPAMLSDDGEGIAVSLRLVSLNASLADITRVTLEALPQPGVTVLFTPTSAQQLATGGSSLSVFAEAFDADAVMFSVHVAGLPAERTTLAFRVVGYDENNAAQYHDVIELDLADESFLRPH